MRYEKTIFVSAKKAKVINRYLHEEPTTEDECLGEDYVYTCTVKFNNSVEMDIKCCGVQFREGESNLAWAEAVLFENGSEACCTEPEAEFFGEWVLEYDGDKYIVFVEIEKETK